MAGKGSTTNTRYVEARVTEKFFISVVIPVHNGQDYIADAIRSIRRQGHNALEIIVVDDGSTDRTFGVVESLGDGIRYIRQTNQGAPAARNHGIRAARGNFIAFLDADDLWTDNKLDMQLPYLRDDPSLHLVRGNTQFMRKAENLTGSEDWETVGPPWPALSLGSAIMSREAFDKVGCLDEKLPFNDDVDWFLRADEIGIGAVVHDDLVQFYRRHDRNMTNDKARNRRYLLRSLKNSIDRRRH